MGVAAFIEGRHSVLEALRSHVPLERVYVAQGVDLARTVPEIAELIAAARIPIQNVSRGWLDEHSERGAHQGIAASVAAFAFTPLGAILADSQDKSSSLLIALDHVTDAGNLGAIARTAEVAGADGLITVKRRSAPFSAGAFKTSAGALAWLAVAQETNLVRALDACKAAGFWIVGASEHAATAIWEVPLEGRLVVVLGAEDSGLSRLVLDACDYTASLPVAGHVGSLNVAQTAAVFAYEWVRRVRTQA